jgi:hypothetical protein
MSSDPDCVNTGIVCDNVAVIDIDIVDPEIAAERVARAKELFGPTPLIRIGRAPKLLLVYRVETPHEKFSTPELFFGDDIDNKDMKVQVEFLGKVQQFVAYGIHPDTREPYYWPNQSPLDIPLADVPVVTLELLQQFKAETEQVLRTAGARPRGEIQDEIRERERQGGQAAGIRDGDKPTREKVEDALNHIPNNVDRRTYIAIGYSIYEAIGESGWSLFNDWAKQHSSYDKKHTTSDWRSFRKGRSITARTLFWHAGQRGWKSKDRTSSSNGQPRHEDRTGAQAKPEPPRPLIRELPPADPFPIDALGDVLGAAAKGIHDRVQSPLAICGQSVLAAATLAVQGYADIELPTGHTNPISSFFITVAASGERKSATDKEALWPVAKHETALWEKYAADYPKYEDNKTAWDKAKEHAIKKAKGDRAEISSALVNLGPPPVVPLTPLLTCPEPTFEGLCKHLIQGQPSIGIFSDEGGMFIGGHGMNPEAKLRTAAGLSGLWDGKPIKRIRAVDGTTILPGRRCSLHLMAQPDVAAKMLSDPELLDQGLLSRCLVTAPETNSGSRLWHEPDVASDAAIRHYGRAILKILELPLPVVEGKANELSPRTVTLSHGAIEMWKTFSDRIEVQLKPEGKLAPIRGLANKLPEHAARLAAVLTLVEDIWACEVSATKMAAGIMLAQHYAEEALRLFESSLITEDLRKAQGLLNWLGHSWTKDKICLRDIYQFGPNAIRFKEIATKIVAILEDHGWMQRIEGGFEIEGHHRRDVWNIKE